MGTSHFASSSPVVLNRPVSYTHLVTELLAEAKLKKGDVFVVGCSSSEIVGGHIGKDSSLEAAQAVYAGIAPVLAAQGIWLAAQCCEHLNRCLLYTSRCV